MCYHEGRNQHPSPSLPPALPVFGAENTARGSLILTKFQVPRMAQLATGLPLQVRLAQALCGTADLQNVCIFPNRNFIPFEQKWPPATGNHHFTLCFKSLAVLDPSHTAVWRYLHFCDELISLSIRSSRFTYVVAFGKLSFFLRLNNKHSAVCMCTPLATLPSVAFMLSPYCGYWE